MKKNPVYDLPADKYNIQLAGLLKTMPEFKQPEWALFVKSGVAKKRPPQNDDFWHKRAASILRQIYTHNVVGVNRLKTRYGSRKNRGMRPERFRKGSGKIIRTILQQAEAAGLLEKYNESGKRAGRRLTEKGREFLENIKLDKLIIDKKESDNKQSKSTESQSDKVRENINKENEKIRGENN